MSEKTELSGMTVNERLFDRGLIEEFERARANWDVDGLKAILSEIALEGYDIEQLR